MRVDKWIWTTWMAKSRTQAGEFCRAGNVLINGVKAKPSKILKIGDEVSVIFPAGEKKYRVLEFLEKRGKQESAEGFFEDLNPTFESLAAEYKKSASAQKRDTRKILGRYGDNKLSKKDRRMRRELEGEI
jgi:ribosome-associated heat shock protein Hsp15